MWAIPTGTSLALKKKNSGQESQYMFLHPELGSDPPIRSGQESGCDKTQGTLGSLVATPSLLSRVIEF